MRAKLLNRKKGKKKQRILYSTLLEIPLNNNEKYVEKTTKSINHTQFSIMLYKYTYISSYIEPKSKMDIAV